MRVVAGGDALFSGGNLAGRLDEKLLEYLGECDAAFVNAEFICPARTTAPAPRRFMTAVGIEAVDELTSIGINLLSFANNHTGDFGPQGVIDTIEACEARGIIHSGIGRSLEEARLPHFLDTSDGRIALISTGTTRSTEFAASTAGTGIPARAGLNPLRWGRAYVLPETEFQQLRRIDEMLGIAGGRKEVMDVEVMADPGPDRLPFGSVFEGSLQFERGSHAHIRYYANEKDAKAILENVRDAANRAEIVLLSLHAHEGTEENWYSPRPAPFLEDFARRAIDAGATAVIGHGPHMLRGIEFYKGKPIFYSLGSLLMEFEAGMQKMTPEMYEAYGFTKDALPSHLHMSRARNAAGEPIGFYGDARFSKSCIALLDIVDGKVSVRLVALDLDLNRKRPSERGLPACASVDLAREIAADMAEMSKAYGTTIHFNESDGLIDVLPG
ncbi:MULTISPECIES: CapA family protein [unclassified Rhizobium]|uniref:CapA family protein n=1 Tax=unclassified Rhizobium TaxID=2613769 RepID=UPI001ADD4E9B|nr:MULTISPECIES: CapA family protein [unclassified Rhizobium]MBO9123824.1 CapA family protein [Rhizobium sp. 16-488-2b]MBO9174356.1 CapA family protein [Rhizobium sp. 16-488-2a]